MSAERANWGDAEHEYEPHVEETIGRLYEEFEKGFEEPPGGDPYMAGLAYAWMFELRSPDSPVREMAVAAIAERIRMRKHVHPASSLANLFRSEYQRQVIYGYGNNAQFQKGLPRGYGNYPYKYRDARHHEPVEMSDLNKIDIARDCIYGLRFMVNDERSVNVGHDAFFHHAAYFDLQTNKTERYGPLRALMTLAYDRLERPISAIDYGCSGNHGLKSIDLRRPQYVQEVVQYVDPAKTLEDYRQEERRDLTARFNNLMNRQNNPLRLAASVGVDVWNPNDTGMYQWRKSCSFRGMEWLNKDKEDEYDFLEQIKRPNVGFVQANLTQGMPPELEGKKFDFGFMSFMLDQQSNSERSELLKNAMSQCRWLVILDAVKLQPDGTLKFAENFYDKTDIFPINVIAIDTESPNPQLETIMQFEDGRCQRARLFKNNIFDRL